MSEPAIVRLLVNHGASCAAFQRAVKAAQIILPSNFNYLGTVFTVTAHQGIVLVTTTLRQIEPVLPPAFADDQVFLLQVEIVGPTDTVSRAKPGWYQDTDGAYLNMFYDPDGVRTKGTPYIYCTCVGGQNLGYELAVEYYHAVLGGELTPTDPF